MLMEPDPLKSAALPSPTRTACNVYPWPTWNTSNAVKGRLAPTFTEPPPMTAALLLVGAKLRPNMLQDWMVRN